MTTRPDPLRKALGELALLCDGELVRAEASTVMSGVATLTDATSGDVSFYTNTAYRRDLAESKAGLIITSSESANLAELAGKPLLIASAPYAAFARVSAAFHPAPVYAPGVDASARIDPSAEVDPSAHIEAFAYVGPGARIQARAVVMVGAYVGAGASIGADTVLSPHAVVRDRCVIGERCLLHSGVVIGSDGFGFAFDPAGDGDGPIHRKVSQIGIVRIEDDVEIGANSCVDRATLGETVVGRGTKIDKLVQIAHNVRIGPMCLIAAQTGIAGSTTVGAGVIMAGQTGIAGHVNIGDMARLGAKVGVHNDIGAGESVVGYPAMEHKKWLRVSAVLTRLPELVREVRRQAKRLTALEGKPSGTTEND